MKDLRGFALFEAILALVLMMIAAGASYTLVKSFRANSSVQQFIRYSTNITQSFMPFVDGTSYDSVLFENQLSKKFLTSIGIPSEDQVSCSSGYCYVNAGMYSNGASHQSPMSFGVKSGSDALASYFIIAVNATGVQVNQMLQSASSMFSIYCPSGKGIALDAQGKCVLQSDDDMKTNGNAYSLFLVFPKSGDTAPSDTGVVPPSGS